MAHQKRGPRPSLCGDPSPRPHRSGARARSPQRPEGREAEGGASGEEGEEGIHLVPERGQWRGSYANEQGSLAAVAGGGEEAAAAAVMRREAV